MVAGKRALSLIELLIAISLMSAVVLTASVLLINFKKFYKDFTDKQETVGEVSLVVLEDIANKILLANQITISSGGSQIDIRIDNSDPSDTADDTVHTYWLQSKQIKYKYKVDGNPDSATTVLTKNIKSLQFDAEPSGAPSLNRVKITVSVNTPGGTTESFDTTVIARCRCAEEQDAPAAPSNLTGTCFPPAPSGYHIHLFWADNSNDETGFEIERGTSPGNETKLVTVGPNSTEYRDYIPNPDDHQKNYYYRIRAFKGSVYSEYSNEVRVWAP
ncbi:MAG: hypothetical protein NTV07_02780 [Candidatus Omnitrophica bacterium]|nr:hypothetical protein [Candidatus Omnitrophota bacterium]